MGFRNFLWLIFLACLWGPSFLFIKVAVGDIPPITLAMSRVGIATLLLYAVLRGQGKNLPGPGRIWKHFAVVGFFSNALPFVLFSWGEQYIDSALAAILNGTTPLFTIILAHFFTADDRMTPVKVMGTLVGFAGLSLLISPSLWGGVHATTWGLLAITMAAASYGIGLVYVRRHLRGLPPLVAPTAQLAVATIYLLPLSLLIEKPFRHPLPSWPAVGSLLGLSVLGTAIAFIIYYRLLERTSATYVSMVTYLAPSIGVVLGVVILNEQLGWSAYAGCVLILVGVMVVNEIFKSIGWRRPGNVAVRP
ncbi:MAG: EamA family transporter [Anaerolineae bacterium]|nr:EamA family transporter [Anaerolineae bacterium]